MISCLMVTRTGRESECRSSIRSFAMQTFTDRELIVVHDGDDAFERHLASIVSQYPDCEIGIKRQSSGKTLGELRNISVAAAQYPLICQWDDDDLNHPLRLDLQFRQLQKSAADFCFMTDQLHFFAKQKILFWDDWNAEYFPGNLIQGTILGNKELLGLYPEKSKGEDTELVFDLVNRHCKITTLEGVGWAYIYVYNGRNTWSEEHHKSISQWKRLTYEKLAPRLADLEHRLREYRLPFTDMTVLHEKGKHIIDLTGS